MSDEKYNVEAVKIANSYFKLRNQRTTPGTFKMTIGQAKNLLKSGFTPTEILIGIQYCIDYPPRKGFTSLGWLSYDLERILQILAVKDIKDNMEFEVTIDAEIAKRNDKFKRNNSESRLGEIIDLKLFE